MARPSKKTNPKLTNDVIMTDSTKRDIVVSVTSPDPKERFKAKLRRMLIHE